MEAAGSPEALHNVTITKKQLLRSTKQPSALLAGQLKIQIENTKQQEKSIPHFM
jgi:hypothetical protein